MALSQYCLDTSAYSNFKRGDRQVVDILDGADWLGMPSVVLGEIEIGFLLGNPDRLAENREELRMFLSNATVEELVVDSEVSRIYADIVVSLRKAGTPLPSNDIWIAAISSRAGATVLTYDAHFDLIQRVGSHFLPVT